jgi:hypothetical protein
MHFHLPFSANEILWTLTFAGHLVVLVVLMGRDRIRRYPWFTASIVLIGFRLLTAKMLYGRLPQVTMAEVFIGLALLGSIVSAMVLLELARKAFGKVSRGAWVGGALALMAIGAAVIATWGKWPQWQTLNAPGLLSHLQLLQLIALKAGLLIDVETVLLGITVALFGRRVGAGWKTHTQRIVLGLATASLSQIVSEAVVQWIEATAKPQSMEEAQKIMDLREHIFYANSAVYVLVLIWWIICLWRDEPKLDGPKLDAPKAGEPGAALLENPTVQDAALPPSAETGI